MQVYLRVDGRRRRMIRIRSVYLMYLFKAVGKRYSLHIQIQHDVGKDLVVVEGAAVHLDLNQLHHLAEGA